MLESSPAAGDTTSTAADTAATDTATHSDATTAASSTANTDANAAASSPAEKPAGTMLDAVKAAIAPKGESPTPKSSDQPAEGDPDSTKTDTEADEELSAEEVKALTAKTQKRFSKLTRDLKAKSAEIEKLGPKAAEFDKIDTFVRNAGLSPQDVAGTLEIAAMLRSNPAEALKRLTPIVSQLQSIVGETLPPDLQTRVDQGYLTEADAKILAKSQAGERLATQRANAIAEQTRVERQQGEFQSRVTATVNSAEAWEAQQASRDPDWHLKRDSIAELVELAIERKGRELRQPYFPTPEEAVELSKEALKTVNDRMKRFGPKPQEIRPVPNGGASPRSTAAPNSLLDVVKQHAGAR